MPNSRGFSLLIGETIVAVDTEAIDCVILTTQSNRQFLIDIEFVSFDDELIPQMDCTEILE